MRRKILVIRGGAVGDFILTLPVLAALRRHFPEHRIEVLGYPAVTSLALAAGLADAASAVESPRLAGLFAPDGSWAADVTAWFGGFDWIVSYLHDPQDVFRRNVARCSSARFVAGPHRPDETQAVHATLQLLAPLRQLDIHDADPRPRLVFPDGGASSASGRLAIHPGSGSPGKNWPEARWRELMGRLATGSTCEVLLIGGEAEGDRCARLAAGFPAERVRMARSLPLVELAREMQTCSAFIGHDSGITHLAAALDLPGLVLWGETELAVWRPQCGGMKILRDAAGLSNIAVDAVFRDLESGAAA
jgi:ADP-heptose:LPS heptosyltransferase